MSQTVFKRVGQVLSKKPNEDGTSNGVYIKISEDVTLKKGDIISVNDPRKQLPELVKSGKMKEETATKILSKLPDFVKFELVYKTQE